MCSDCDSGNANLLLALNSVCKVIHKAIREKETSNELWNQMLYAGEAHSVACILLFCFGECCNVLGNFKYRCKHSLYPKAFMLGAIFLFVVGGEVGIQSTKMYLWKRSLFFRMEQQIGLETSYWIFLHANSQPPSTRKDVSLRRCCERSGHKQDGSCKKKSGWPTQIS